ncbi:hypothetical protein HGRIS_005480 [Hohenbuehelia grisea]|uniref:Alpha-type protein kinase domain-containing protein n=1 Tax=Hohenbuehelia grisea TaxID=104357 RepID=A0ABR3JZ76_9AGAR
MAVGYAGYTANHKSYTAEKKQMAKKAHAQGKDYKVTVMVEAVRMPERKDKAEVLWDLVEALGNISVNIGARQLKELAFKLIAPKWANKTDSYPLGIDDVALRDHLWAPIIEQDPDVSVIRHHYFRQTAKGETFKQGSRAKVYLHVPNELYDAWLESLDETDFLQAAGRTGKKRIKASTSRTVPDNLDSVVGSGSHHTPQGNHHLEITPNYNEMRIHLDAPSLLDDTLRGQVFPSPKKAHSLFFDPNRTKPVDAELIDVEIWPVLRMTLPELIEVATQVQNGDHTRVFGEPRAMKLVINVLANNKKKGAFKVAVRGHTTEPLFSCHHEAPTKPFTVCAKQAFYTKFSEVAKDDGGVQRVKQDIVFGQIRQSQILLMEVICLVWASALQTLVTSFISFALKSRKSEAHAQQPPFPTMRFVEAAIAVERVPAGEDARVFLLEEFIEASEFKKYLNNSSPDPTRFTNPDLRNRGAFLSFAQHVQYIETGGKLFVADYQGGISLLTDP